MRVLPPRESRLLLNRLPTVQAAAAVNARHRARGATAHVVVANSERLAAHRRVPPVSAVPNRDRLHPNRVRDPAERSQNVVRRTQRRHRKNPGDSEVRN